MPTQLSATSQPALTTLNVVNTVRYEITQTADLMQQLMTSLSGRQTGSLVQEISQEVSFIGISSLGC
jgi:hypothetical protein